LRRVKDLSQREVAQHMGLAEKTIEKHLREGARLLAHYMRAHVPPNRLQATDVDARDDDEIEHG
jgi:DNA-directed RNA polymerase specialized sigma24 family protein